MTTSASRPSSAACTASRWPGRKVVRPSRASSDSGVPAGALRVAASCASGVSASRSSGASSRHIARSSSSAVSEPSKTSARRARARFIAGLQGGGEDGVGRLGGVEDDEPVRLGGGQLVVGLSHAREELAPRALEPVGLAARDPRQPGVRVDPQQQRAVRRQPAGPERVQRPDLLDAELAPAALVGERGVDEAVEQHGLARVEQRLELLGHELRARRGVQQRLGARVDVSAGSATSSRIRSDSSTPPGSRSTVAPSSRARPAISVVLPAPSRPSTVISTRRSLTYQEVVSALLLRVSPTHDRTKDAHDHPQDVACGPVPSAGRSPRTARRPTRTAFRRSWRRPRSRRSPRRPASRSTRCSSQLRRPASSRCRALRPTSSKLPTSRASFTP